MTTIPSTSATDAHAGDKPVNNLKIALNAAHQTDDRKLRAALRSNLLYNHYLPTPSSRPPSPRPGRTS